MVKNTPKKIPTKRTGIMTGVNKGNNQSLLYLVF